MIFKKLALVLAGILAFSEVASAGQYSVTMTSTNPATNEAGGGVAWSSVGDVTVQDSIPGSLALKPFEISDYANVTKFSGTITTAISARATITGVSVTAVCQCDTADSCQVTEAQLVNDITPQGSTDAASKPMETSYKDVTIGGDGSMWGLTSAQIKSLIQQKFFGFRFLVSEIAGNTVTSDCDGTTVIVYYDLTHLLSSLGAGA